MTKIDTLEVEIHATDIAMHDVFKELAQKIYAESGIKINDISFDWYKPYDMGFEKKFHLLNVKIYSSK